MPLSRTVPALRVHQWLPQWENLDYKNSTFHRRRPSPNFYLFSLRAKDLRRLAGVFRRSTKGGRARASDLNIQRFHEKERSDKIARYLKYGYPLSDLMKADPEGSQYLDLRKPGWLANAIVVNILGKDEKRRGKAIDEADRIKIADNGVDAPEITLPGNFRSASWAPKIRPLEVIDGQHRLWAFDVADLDPSFELPVVGFDNLDISWQAYLFWTINISPKRISPSLAYDLYPLLRTEDWLERYGGERVYRETRAQEITEAIWSHPESPWKGRVAMLGEKREEMSIEDGQVVSQASWVRALVGTFIRSWNNRSGIGGLFGARVGSQDRVLPWGRPQHAAVCIYVWRTLAQALEKDRTLDWAKYLRKRSRGSSIDAALFGDGALLSTDQGIRGVMYMANDLLYMSSDALGLEDWTVDTDGAATDLAAVSVALESFHQTAAARFWRATLPTLLQFDWRTAGVLPSSERKSQSAFRGSGGYREIRSELANLLARDHGEVGTAARKVVKLLKTED